MRTSKYVNNPFISRRGASHRSHLPFQFVSNKSQEGAQFVKGFGGIGGILRYKVDFTNMTGADEDEDEFYSDSDDGI